MSERPRCIVCGKALAADTTCCVWCLPPPRKLATGSAQRALELWRERMQAPPKEPSA